MNNGTSGENLEFHTVIPNQEQLLESYGKAFEEVKTESVSFFLEKKANVSDLPKNRYVVTPSGLVLLSFKGKDNVVWNIQKEDIDILGQVNALAAEQKFKLEGEYPKEYIPNKGIDISGHYVTAEYIPYGTISTERVVSDLDYVMPYLEKSNIE